ncbi:putative sporulation protein YyaC [Gottschalkia purinilytica]|uniref:Putative sporulation protein YyaC n=1 Tax=Gottschalkia purinilytica TaxID=1503 RepID=A0A0L0WE37_GOTPU|nr:spore protease YyaC [Gottschalkia purinilytica]KNF09685.1 putative sporulation protein YyaC [Gottschalkia purinilytica]
MYSINEISVSFTNNSASELIGRYVKPFLHKDNKYNDVIIVCIGTDRCIGDCLGPLVGTMLKEKNFPINVYGTVEDPIHAVNLSKKLYNIKQKHPNAFIIAIDASLGEKESIGSIQIRKGPIYPGKGVGKKLQSVGDLSIIGIVNDGKSSNGFALHNVRLSFIMDLAKSIVTGLTKAL